MSLQWRLMAGVLGLFCLLAVLAWLGLRGLTGSLREALGESATEVGRAVVTVLRTAPDGSALPIAAANAQASSDGAVPGIGIRELQVHLNGRRLRPEEVDALRTESLPAPVARLLQEGAPLRIVRRLDDEELSFSVEGFGGQRRIVVPTSPLARALGEFSERVAWGLAGLLLLGAIGAGLLARYLGAPLAALARTAARVGEGRLGEQVALQGPPEVRASLDAFNRMSADLARLQAQAARQREERALAELGEIGRGLAHSLRNPLHALGLGLDALAAGRGDAAALASASRAQLQRIDQALRAFLALSAAAGAEATEVELGALIDDVLLEASQRAAGRVRLQREVEPAQLLAVAAELRILVHTLVMNAIEASPDGGRVCVRARSEADGVVLEVEDEGTGVDPTLRSRLFQPHVTSKAAGAGMGLYLSERLARQRYAGGIELEDRAPRGTLARLRLGPRISEDAADAR
jgi:signal transduction histidine kinase